MNNIGNVIAPFLTEKLGDKFFKYWIAFLKPIHHLSEREMDIIACFLKHRYYLSKVISDSKILNTVLMGESTKKKVREEVGITSAHFQVIMSKLKRSKIIVNNEICPKLIPTINDETGTAQLLLLFQIK